MPKWGDKHVTGNGSWCWGITKTAKNPEAAAAFLAYLLEADRLVEWSTKGGHPPASKSATAKSELYRPGGKLAIYSDQLAKIAMPRPAHPAYPVITAAFAQAVQDAIDGANVQEALDKAAKAIDLNIEDNSGYPPFGAQ
jgi:multiple sugar transport system substrate-binding protein